MVLKCKLNCLFFTRLSIPGCCYKKISAYRTVLSTFSENVSLSKIVGFTLALKATPVKATYQQSNLVIIFAVNFEVWVPLEKNNFWFQQFSPWLYFSSFSSTVWLWMEQQTEFGFTWNRILKSLKISMFGRLLQVRFFITYFMLLKNIITVRVT